MIVELMIQKYLHISGIYSPYAGDLQNPNRK